MRDLTTERLLLRRFATEDLDQLVAYRSDPDVARYQSWDAGFSLADAQRLLDEQRDVEFGEPGEWLQLAIVDIAARDLWGECAVRMVTDQPATAELGITLSPMRRRRGVADEALRAVIHELFAAYDVHRIVAHVDDRNEKACRLFERLGMRCEARLVDADWFKGEWTTLRIYAMLSSESPAARTR